jgi:hypothetical protein
MTRLRRRATSVIGATFMVFALTGCGPTFIRDPADEVCEPGEARFFGRVLHEGTQQPIAGVSISTEPPTDLRRTDAKGCFHIERNPTAPDDPIPPGRYKLHINPRIGEATVKGQVQELEMPADPEFLLEDDPVWVGRFFLRDQSTPDDNERGSRTNIDFPRQSGGALPD